VTSYEDQFVRGNVVRLTGRYTDALNNEAPIEPDDVVLRIKPPSGVELAHGYNPGPIVKVDDQVGVFIYDLLLDASGPWEWRWESSAGAVVAADEGKVVVRTSPFPLTVPPETP
jgi:hypothetical protein